MSSNPVAATPKTSVILELTPSSSVAFNILKSTPQSLFKNSKLAVRFTYSYESIASTAALFETRC